MPHLIDSCDRNRLLSDAVLGLVRGGGVEAVTVRAVAATLGIGVSSVRHLCPTREELLTRAMVDLANRRERTRRAAGLRLWESRRSQRGVAVGDRRVDGLVDYLVECELPLDQEELEPIAAWLTLSSWPSLSPRARGCVETDSADQLAVCCQVAGADDDAGVLLRSVLRGLLLDLTESGSSAMTPVVTAVDETERLLRRAVDALIEKGPLAPEVNDR